MPATVLVLINLGLLLQDSYFSLYVVKCGLLFLECKLLESVFTRMTLNEFPI